MLEDLEEAIKLYQKSEEVAHLMVRNISRFQSNKAADKN